MKSVTTLGPILDLEVRKAGEVFHIRRDEHEIIDYSNCSEIAAEALVRNLPSFAGFLQAAAIGDTELVNFTNIAILQKLD